MDGPSRKDKTRQSIQPANIDGEVEQIKPGEAGKKFRIFSKSPDGKSEGLKAGWVNSIQGTHQMLNQVSLELKQICDQLDSILGELAELDDSILSRRDNATLQEIQDLMHSAADASSQTQNIFKRKVQSKIDEASGKISSFDKKSFSHLSTSQKEKLKVALEEIFEMGKKMSLKKSTTVNESDTPVVRKRKKKTTVGSM